MRPAAYLIVPVLAVPLLSGASASDTERYRLEKTDDGYVRMDTRTGEMSVCAERRGEMVCRMAADERTAMQDEIDRLQGDVESLEHRVDRLENSLTARVEKTLPTEEEFDKSLDYMERFFRGFMGIVKELEDEADRPGSDRT